jgi:hypothetical protein
VADARRNGKRLHEHSDGKLTAFVELESGTPGLRGCETFFKVDSWPPVAVSIVRTVDLFGEPLKPFPRFLRTCALTFVLNVVTTFRCAGNPKAGPQLNQITCKLGLSNFAIWVFFLPHPRFINGQSIKGGNKHHETKTNI